MLKELGNFLAGCIFTVLGLWLFYVCAVLTCRFPVWVASWPLWPFE